MIRLPCPRFSLRTLVIFVLLCGSGLGLWNHLHYRWRPWQLALKFKCSGGPFIFGEGNAPQSARFTSDCTRIITVGATSVPQLWDAQTGENLYRMPDSEVLKPGETFIGGSPSQLRVASVDVSLDGQRVALVREGSVRLYDTARNELIREFSDDTPGDRLQHAIFGSDADTLITMSWQGVVKLWHGEGGPLELPEKSHRWIFSRNRQWLLTWDFGEQPAQLWEVSTGKLLRTFPHLKLAQFSPNGQYLGAYWQGTVRVYEVASGRELGNVEGYGEMAVAPDGHMIASRKGNAMLLFDLTRKKVLASSSDAMAAYFPPDANRVVTAYRALRVFDAYDGTLLSELREHREGTVIEWLDFSPDGKRLLSVDYDNICCVWARVHPEYWWGVAWLPEFWATLVFGVGLGWSVWRDRRALRSRRAVPPASEGGDRS